MAPCGHSSHACQSASSTREQALRSRRPQRRGSSKNCPTCSVLSMSARGWQPRALMPRIPVSRRCDGLVSTCGQPRHRSVQKPSATSGAVAAVDNYHSVHTSAHMAHLHPQPVDNVDGSNRIGEERGMSAMQRVYESGTMSLFPLSRCLQLQRPLIRFYLSRRAGYYPRRDARSRMVRRKGRGSLPVYGVGPGHARPRCGRSGDRSEFDRRTGCSGTRCLRHQGSVVASRMIADCRRRRGAGWSNRRVPAVLNRNAAAASPADGSIADATAATLCQPGEVSGPLGPAQCSE